MQTSSLAHPSDFFPSSGPLSKLGPLGVIIALHLGLFLLMQAGLFRHTVQATHAPKEIVATFITPEPQPVPAPPQPVAPKPKTVPIVKKKPAPVKPLPRKLEPAPMQETVSPPTEAAPPSDAPVVTAPSAPAPQAAAPVLAVPKTITGVEYIQAPRPDYPSISKRMGEEGKVLLRVLINEKGRPEKAEIQRSSGFDRLDEAARQSAMRALFKPHMEDGRPVAVYTTIPIDFKLNK